MRPIFITSLTLMAGAFAIISDPIFNGMAISLLFGAGVSTVMAFVIIPMGCISAKKQFYVETSDDGTVRISPSFERIEKVSADKDTASSGTSLLMRFWGGIFSVFAWVFIGIKAVFTLIMMGFKGIFGGRGGGTPPPPRAGGTPPPPPKGGGTPPPPRETPKGGGTPPPPREAPKGGGTPTPATAKGGGTPPPPREAPKGGGTPPPPREVPKGGGTPPPPREAPKGGGTPPPPREEPKAEEAPPAPKEEPAKQAKAQADVTEKGEAVAEGEQEGGAGQKRRGIRLKQDLS